MASPTLTPESTAWLEGIKAFENAQPRKSNPYHDIGAASVRLADQWFSGWDLAAVIIVHQPAAKEMEAAHG